MRKLKLFLSLLMVMAFSLGNVWGADYELVYTLDGSVTTGGNSNYAQDGGGLTQNSINWSVTGNTTINPWRIGGKSLNNVDRLAYSKTAIADNIAKIEIEHGTINLTVNSMKVEVASNSDFSTIVSEFTPSCTQNNTVTITRPAGKDWSNCFYRLTYNVTAGSSNTYVQLKSVKFYKEAEAAAFTITAATNNESYGTVALSGSVITATPKEGYRIASTAYTVTAGSATVERGTGENLNKFTVTPTTDCTVQINFEDIPQYVVTWNVNGATSTSKVEEGAQPVFPATPASCDGTSTTFVGWATAPWSGKIANIDGKTVYAKAADMPAVTEAVTYYAVFAKSSGTGAFDGVNGGTFKIYALVDETKYYALGTVTSSKINSTTDAAEAADFEIEAVSGGFTIKSGDKYISYTSSTNLAAVDDPYTWSIVAGSYGSWRVNSATAGRAWIYRAGTTNKYGGYSSSNVNGTEYFDLEIGGNASYSDYLTTCAEIKNAVTFAAPTGGTLSIMNGEDPVSTDTEIVEGTALTVTATPDAKNHYIGGTIKVVKTSDESDVTASVLDGSTLTMPDYAITVSATFTPTYAINLVAEGGSIALDYTKGGAEDGYAIAGTEIMATATADDAHVFASLALSENVTVKEIDENVATFTMPDEAVTITATFDAKSTPTIIVSQDAIDFGKAVKGGAAPAFETFTISGANLTGDLSLAWEESDGYFTWTVTEGSLTANAGIVEATISVTATEKAMNTAGTLMDNLIVSGGGATQKEVMVGVEVQQTYTAKWFVNGEELTESTQTAVAGTDLIVPTNPTKLADDCADLKFRGWAAAPIDGKLDEAPEFVTTEGLKMGDADANYYAVFATENKEEIDGDIEWVATAFADLATNDSIVVTYAKSSVVYALPNNEGTSSSPDATVVTVANGKLSAEPAATLRWKAVKDGDNIQFATGTSFLYCTNSNDGVRVGSGTANVFSIKDNYIYTSLTTDARYVGVNGTQDWRCYKSINSNIQDATLAFYKKTVSKQEVTSYIDFRTTCPSCKTVTLLKADAEHGSFILKQNGVEVTAPVKTCDAAEITIEATPNPGCQFKFANISTLSGASISGTTITLEAGTEGELTVSASFAQNDYKVVLLQTGDAEAELTGATEAAHYGDKIDVSAPAMGGFHFIGWEASGVTLTDATALSQSFSMPANDVTLTAKYAKILTVAEAIAKINADGTSNDQVVEGYISQIDSYNSKYSSITYWIKDIDANGFLTGTAFEVYGGLGLNGAGFTSEDNIVVGAKVRVFGQIKYYETQSIYEFNSNNYQLAYDAGTYTGVVIYGEASKTAYEAGEAFEFDGLNAKDTWSNGYASLLTVKDDGLTWTATPDNITESGDVTVKASYEYDEKTYEGTTKVAVTVLTHAVTFEAPANGSLVVKNGETPITSGDKFVKGTVLTVEATPAIGYKLATLTVNGNDVKAEKQFEIGTESQYEVVATFSEKAEAGIAWSAAEATAVDYEGAVNALPTLTNTASLEVAYESTNTDVAEIAANGDVTIKAAGTTTIKAIFAGNETYKAATVTYDLTVNHVPVVKLAGSFNSWTGALLTPNEDYTEASVKVNFAADSWPLFKMIVDEAWLGLPMDGENNYLFHRDWNTVAISDAGENIQLKADFEGEYTFTWTYATNTLTITFPDMPEPEYYIAGGFTSWEDNMAKMTEDAGMYKATVTINATEPQEFKVVRVQGPYKTWYGLAGEATMTPENCTNWIIGGDANIGLQPSYAGKYTFYFNEGDMQLTIDMPTEPGTALDNTEAGEKAAKVMLNGQLLIIKNGKTFNAQGAVVK